MKPERKRDFARILIWIFVGAVAAQSAYVGFKHGCWWGFITIVVGLLVTIVYPKLKRKK